MIIIPNMQLFNFLYTCWINHSPTNWRFRPLKSFHKSQFSTYKHPTTFIVKRKKVRIHTYLDTSIHWFFFYTNKVALHEILFRISKRSQNFIVHNNWPQRYISILIYFLNAMITSNFRFLSKLNGGKTSSAPQNRFIFYSKFSLRLTENFHKQKHFLERWSSCFVYNIFLWNL